MKNDSEIIKLEDFMGGVPPPIKSTIFVVITIFPWRYPPDRILVPSRGDMFLNIFKMIVV